MNMSALPPDAQSGDLIARCLLPGYSVRVVIATTTDVAREAARRHEARGGVAAAMGRAATAGLMLATLTKGDERVTLQLLGTGPLESINVDAAATGGVRVYVKNPAIALPTVPGQRVVVGQALGRTGVVNVIRDLSLKERFGGRTDFVDGEIDTDVEHYLTHSEQIDSVLSCETVLGPELGIAASAGILLQTLPGSPGGDLLKTARANVRAGALDRALRHRQSAPTVAEIARAVLGEAATDLMILDVRPVVFFCPCSRQRAASSVALLGSHEIETMIDEGKDTTVTCHFCRETYVFAAANLEAIRVHSERTGTPPD